MACIIVAYTVMAYTVTVDVVMAYIVMPYIVMAVHGLTDENADVNGTSGAGQSSGGRRRVLADGLHSYGL